MWVMVSACRLETKISVGEEAFALSQFLEIKAINSGNFSDQMRDVITENMCQKFSAHQAHKQKILSKSLQNYLQNYAKAITSTDEKCELLGTQQYGAKELVSDCMSILYENVL